MTPTSYSLIRACGLLLISALLLTSCASKPVSAPASLPWKDRNDLYSRLTQWDLKGRLGLVTSQQSGSVTLVWQESDKGRQLRLLGPAGQGLAKLDQTTTGTVIRDNHNNSWQGDTPEPLIEQAIGWEIPLSSLRWWVLGIVEPDSDTRFSLDDQERLQQLEQDGWQVSFSKYRMFDGYELPGSIVFQSSVETQGRNLRGKFILKEWRRTQP